VLINHCEEAYHYKKGDKIAQLILEKIDDDAILEEVDEIDKLGVTQRGTGKFGSTGV
jgi:dUTPase